MQKFSPNRVGVYCGLVIAFGHLVWAVLVMLGVGQMLLDFILAIHFLSNPYQVVSFNVGTAALLVVITGVIGYLVGYMATLVWNKMQTSG